MGHLDEIVIAEVAKQVLDPAHLGEMLQAYVRAGSEREDQKRERLSKLRHAHKEAEVGIARLISLVEQGVMEAEDPSLRGRFIGLKLQRDERAKDIADLQRRISTGEPQITPDKIDRLSHLLRERLHNGEPEFRQAYARLVMDEVKVSDEEIRISGSKAVLARCVAAGGAPAAPIAGWMSSQEIPVRPSKSLAAREGKTERSIRMTLSLAFVAPAIVKAAIEGRLPRGFGVKRLIDLPMAWPQQWRALGLKAPTPI